MLENTAGAGGTIGRSLEEISQIISHVEDKSRVGVCLDTCHLFASGFDIAKVEAFEKLMKEFEELIGLKYLSALHLNDCKSKLNSKLDRHDNIGKGNIGIDCFRYVMVCFC